jgi:sugar (pentulose or hexulose) kinase
VDIGSSGIRASVIDARGRLAAQARIAYPARFTGPAGWGGNARCAEAPAEIFRAGLGKIVARILAAAGISPRRLAGIAVSAMAPGVLAVDARCRALGACILYQDRRAVAEAELIHRRIGEERVRELSGNGIDPYYGLVKTLWLLHHEPACYRRAAKILSLKDYLVGCLTGRLATDCSHAGLGGIAFDIRAGRWNEAILRELGLNPDKLPEIMPADEVAGTVSEAAAARFGLAAGIPVAVGMIDSAAGYLACGSIRPAESAMSLGSSCCWGMYHEQPLFVPRLNITRAPWSRSGFLTNASQAAAGAVLGWITGVFRSSTGAEKSREALFRPLEEEAGGLAPGSGGLLTLPYFLGERTPIWDPRARGVIFGLTLSHMPAHLYRSAVEGLAFNFYAGKLLLERAGLALQPQVLAAGGAASPLVCGILADVLNLEIRCLSGQHRSDYGDAWLAGKAVGLFEDYKLLLDKRCFSGRHLPDPGRHRVYRGIYERAYSELYPRLRGIFRKL